LTTEDAEQLQIDSRAQWRRWLAKHHARTEGLWLVTWKKASGGPYVSYDDVVEEAVAQGWIDSKSRALDGERSMLWLAPRKPRTGWSAPNKARVERLLAAKLMHAAGSAKIEAAQRDGSWEKLDAVEQLTVPSDLAAALKRQPPAAAHFDAFPRSIKRGILEWIVQAKKPETRARRIDDTARLAQRNERANQWARKN
jgi:uncharacterized protein YdeI (YjbR/CyaY-like superfamily)